MLLVLRHSLFLVVVMFSFLYANLFSVFVSCILLKKNYLVLPLTWTPCMSWNNSCKKLILYFTENSILLIRCNV